MNFMYGTSPPRSIVPKRGGGTRASLVGIGPEECRMRAYGLYKGDWLLSQPWSPSYLSLYLLS